MHRGMRMASVRNMDGTRMGKGTENGSGGMRMASLGNMDDTRIGNKMGNGVMWLKWTMAFSIEA